MSCKQPGPLLIKARRNLKYALIRSPIDGIVIVKNAEEGRRSPLMVPRPTLFEIAAAISHLEILVNVDERDIGDIKEGQKVQFEVHTGALRDNRHRQGR